VQVSAGLQPSKKWFIEAKLEADTAVTPEIAQHVQVSSAVVQKKLKRGSHCSAAGRRCG
jgi:hypothetical protein